MVFKILIGIVALIVAGALFLPGGTGEIQNLPILIALVSLFVLFWLVRFIKTWIFVHRTTKLLKSNYMNIKHVRVLFTTAYIVAERKGSVYALCLYRGVNRRCRYHFETERTLEVYRTMRWTFLGPRSRVYRGAVMTKLVRRVIFRELNIADARDAHRVILFNIFPETVTDPINHSDEGPLCEGDAICGTDTVLHSLNGFREQLTD